MARAAGGMAGDGNRRQKNLAERLGKRELNKRDTVQEDRAAMSTWMRLLFSITWHLFSTAIYQHKSCIRANLRLEADLWWAEAERWGLVRSRLWKSCSLPQSILEMDSGPEVSLQGFLGTDDKPVPRSSSLWSPER